MWTDATDRSIEAVPISADEGTVWLRVLATQTLHAVPLDRLSQEDRDFVAGWRKSSAAGYSLDPASTERWPVEYAGATSARAVEAESTPGRAKIWRTPQYELHDYARLDTETIQALARICESVDGACRSAPLPLLWGRDVTRRRSISIYPDEASYRAAGALPGTAGTFIPATGAVLIHGPGLEEEDLLGRARGFSLEKRQRYHVLVHELVHQATMGIILADFPAWVPEGLAEYFAAVQRTPGRFQFHNSHLAVKRHIVESMGYDGVVEFESYPLWTLEQGYPLDSASTAWGCDSTPCRWSSRGARNPPCFSRSTKPVWGTIGISRRARRETALSRSCVLDGKQNEAPFIGATSVLEQRRARGCRLPSGAGRVRGV